MTDAVAAHAPSPSEPLLARALPLLLAALVIVFAVIGIVGTFIARAATSGATSLAIMGVLGLGTVGLVVVLRRRIAAGVGGLARMAERQPLTTWLLAVFVLGMVLRVAMFAMGEAEQTRDKLAYFTLATLIAAGEPIVLDTYMGLTRAFYPPGMGFALAPFISLFGAGPMALLAFNTVLFAAALWLSARFCRMLGLEAAARIAPLAIALWPNHIVSTPLATKELLAGLLAAGVIMLAIAAARRGEMPGWRAVVAGVLLGAAALVQPAVALLGGAVVVVDLFVARRWRGMFVRAAAIALVSAAVIAPWSVRNYVVFDKFIPLTTAGGAQFYMANNDAATGQWILTEKYFPDWENYREEEWDAVAMQRAVTWIAENPVAFVKKIPGRHVYFLCCSDGNVFDWLNLGLGVTDWRYQAGLRIANVGWFAILGLAMLAAGWALARGAGAWRARQSGGPPVEAYVVLVTPILIAFLLHSIGQSGTRFNFMYFMFWAPLAGLLAEFASRPGRNEG